MCKSENLDTKVLALYLGGSPTLVGACTRVCTYVFYLLHSSSWPVRGHAADVFLLMLAVTYLQHAPRLDNTCGACVLRLNKNLCHTMAEDPRLKGPAKALTHLMRCRQERSVTNVSLTDVPVRVCSQENQASYHCAISTMDGRYHGSRVEWDCDTVQQVLDDTIGLCYLFRTWCKLISSVQRFLPIVDAS